MDYFLTKDTSDAVKDVDEKTGIVTGYFAIFENKDSDDDIILPGAFKKSLKENGPASEHPRILHLYQHDVWKPLARPHVLKEDKRGLYFESKITDTTYGQDVLKLYRNKVLTEHSIGFQIVKREVDEREGIQKLMELKLFEGSTVSWGANMEALVQTVEGKSEVKKEQWDILLKKFSALEHAVRDGDYTDETARQLEIQFKQLQQLVISLATQLMPEQSTSHVDEPELKADEFIGILKLK